MTPLPTEQPVALIPNATYEGVALVKNTHSVADLTYKASILGLVVTQATEGAAVKTGYRYVNFKARATRAGTLPWAAPKPVSWVDGTSLVSISRYNSGSLGGVEAMWQIYKGPSPIAGLGEVPTWHEPTRHYYQRVWKTGEVVRHPGLGYMPPPAQLPRAVQVALQALIASASTLTSEDPDGSSRGAVVFYQRAGNLAVVNLGPAIDQAYGGPTGGTQAAWSMNAMLQAINNGNAASTTPASAADTGTARAYLQQMLQLYQQAIAAGQAAVMRRPQPSVFRPTLLTGLPVGLLATLGAPKQLSPGQAPGFLPQQPAPVGPVVDTGFAPGQKPGLLQRPTQQALMVAFQAYNNGTMLMQASATMQQAIAAFLYSAQSSLAAWTAIGKPGSIGSIVAQIKALQQLALTQGSGAFHQAQQAQQLAWAALDTPPGDVINLFG